MAKFKEGDVVQLKSGGPKMTVERVHSESQYECQWFSGSKLEEGFFPGISLIPVVPEEKKPEKK